MTTRCVHCKYLNRRFKDGGIGTCELYGVVATDSLCGCETHPGKTILWNFETKSTPNGAEINFSLMKGANT